MDGFTRRQQALRRRAARLLLPAADRGAGGRDAFYPQQPTCQVHDLWFLFATFLGERTHGTFVEIGANDGLTVSNTWGLAKRGWTGVLVEPVPATAAACRRNHAAHPRVTVVQSAVGAPGRSEVELWVGGLLTTADPQVREEYGRVAWASPHLTSQRITVPCTTLDALLTAQDVEPGFDVLVVDVEGFETEVFAGFDLGAWRPAMMIVELSDLHPSLRVPAAGHARLETEIAAMGYRTAYKDGMNTVLVRADLWADAFGLV